MFWYNYLEMAPLLAPRLYLSPPSRFTPHRPLTPPCPGFVFPCFEKKYTKLPPFCHAAPLSSPSPIQPTTVNRQPSTGNRSPSSVLRPPSPFVPRCFLTAPDGKNITRSYPVSPSLGLPSPSLPAGRIWGRIEFYKNVAKSELYSDEHQRSDPVDTGAKWRLNIEQGGGAFAPPPALQPSQLAQRRLRV
jgi:hypothetical protein